jgi:hypothetical protein
MKNPLWTRPIGDLVDKVIIFKTEDRKGLHAWYKIAVPGCFFSMLAGQIIGYIIAFLLFGEI